MSVYLCWYGEYRHSNKLVAVCSTLGAAMARLEFHAEGRTGWYSDVPIWDEQIVWEGWKAVQHYQDKWGNRRFDKMTISRVALVDTDNFSRKDTTS